MTSKYILVSYLIYEVTLTKLIILIESVVAYLCKKTQANKQIPNQRQLVTWLVIATKKSKEKLLRRFSKIIKEKALKFQKFLQLFLLLVIKRTPMNQNKLSHKERLKYSRAHSSRPSCVNLLTASSVSSTHCM